MKNNIFYKVAIIGGGTAGIAVAARLSKKIKPQEIVIVDPSENHYYQPLWSLSAAGILAKEKSVRKLSLLIPSGVNFIQDSAKDIFPTENYFRTDNHQKIFYEYLVVCPGLQLDWYKIKGLKKTLGKNNVVSIYSYSCIDATWETIKTFKSGNAVFTQPDIPYKCSAAPQKIMYLAEDYFHTNNIKNTSISFFSPGESIFPVKKYKESLEIVQKRKNIKTIFNHNLVEVIPDKNLAVFEETNNKELVKVTYDMLHVTPPMSAPDFIKNSPLSDNTGWVDVDFYTLQHKRFTNIFALGDIANLMPASKTGAAIRKQAPVVVENLVSLIKGKRILKKYNGYTSCPIVTDYGKVILTEFGYDNIPMETFPFDQSKPRRSMYLLKKNILPKLYWDFILKGKI